VYTDASTLHRHARTHSPTLTLTQAAVVSQLILRLAVEPPEHGKTIIKHILHVLLPMARSYIPICEQVCWWLVVGGCLVVASVLMQYRPLGWLVLLAVGSV
jgi:hypothetical protein